MALQFQPPPDWLMQEYMNRKSPAQAALEGAQQTAQTYMAFKTQQNSQALAQQQKDIEMAKGLAANGQDFTDAYNQIVAARTPQPKVPFSTPLAPTALGGALNPDTVNPQANAPSQQIRASLAMGHPQHEGIDYTPHLPQTPMLPPTQSTGTVPSPMTTSIPTDPRVQEYQKDPLAFKKQHGSSGIEQLTKQVGIDKALNPTSTDYSTEQATLLTKDNPKASAVIGAFPKDKVPKDVVHLLMQQSNRLDIGSKEDQFYTKEWDKIVKDTNPLTASSRSTLGMASKANFQADRALTTLSKPIVTNQEAGNAMADIAAIYQTGSPTQFGMSHQEYSTLYGKAQGLVQAITGKPQDAVPDAIKQRLVGVLNDMKGTNNAVLKQQLDLTEKSKTKIIKHGYEQEWKDLRASLETNPNVGASALSNNEVIRTSPDGTKHVFDATTKKYLRDVQ